MEGQGAGRGGGGVGGGDGAGRRCTPLWGERIRETPFLRPVSFYHHCDGLKIGV